MFLGVLPLYFNSIKVRLKPNLNANRETTDLNFNSIKVRLKHSNEWLTAFHTRKFQFHKGTIKTGHRIVTSVYYSYFNSIKVRLKQSHLRGEAYLQQEFQFHKGTIKTLVLGVLR